MLLDYCVGYFSTEWWKTIWTAKQLGKLQLMKQVASMSVTSIWRVWQLMYLASFFFFPQFSPLMPPKSQLHPLYDSHHSVAWWQHSQESHVYIKYWLEVQKRQFSSEGPGTPQQTNRPSPLPPWLELHHVPSWTLIPDGDNTMPLMRPTILSHK